MSAAATERALRQSRRLPRGEQRRGWPAQSNSCPPRSTTTNKHRTQHSEQIATDKHHHHPSNTPKIPPLPPKPNNPQPKHRKKIPTEKPGRDGAPGRNIPPVHGCLRTRREPQPRGQQCETHGGGKEQPEPRRYESGRRAGDQQKRKHQ